MVAIEERHFNPIVWQSAFVPQLQAPLYALGFARFFQGDFASATHLLIPQFEPSLRHILKAHGADPTRRRDDATEEDSSLDAIIGNHRPELNDILGAPLLEELDRVFNIQPGPALRHDVAHGQMSAGQCYSPDVIYACWLLYRVCCLFLMEKWDEWVRPGLEIEEPGTDNRPLRVGLSCLAERCRRPRRHANGRNRRILLVARLLWRRSLDRTYNGHSGPTARTGLHAPRPTFDPPNRKGSAGWKAASALLLVG
jgi:hypothetical protein